MPASKPKKDRDEIVVAHEFFQDLIDFTEAAPVAETPKQARARKGGQARAKNLSSRKRSEIAKKAAQKRWESSSK